MNGCSPGLALMERLRRTWKWAFKLGRDTASPVRKQEQRRSSGDGAGGTKEIRNKLRKLNSYHHQRWQKKGRGIAELTNL